MRHLRALKSLSSLVVAEVSDPVGELSDALRIVGAAIGSRDVRVFVGDGTHTTVYPPSASEDFFGLSPGGLMALNQALRGQRTAAVLMVGAEGLPDDVAPADGSRSASYLGLTLWIGGAYGGTLIARGEWSARAAQREGQFLDTAGPVISVALERVVDADRLDRVQRQIDALANVVRVFNRTGSLQDVLSDLVRAINSASGFLSSIDVLNARGRIALRSTAASRYTGTPLYDAWLDMIKAPDPIRKMILEDHRPVFLPDLQGSQSLAAKLAAAGAEEHLIIVQNAEHGLVPKGGPLSPSLAAVIEAIGEFLDRTLHTGQSTSAP